MGSTMEHWDWDYVIDWEVQWSNGALGLRLCNWLGSTMEHWDWDYVIDWEVGTLRLCNWLGITMEHWDRDYVIDWEVQWSIGIEIM